MKVQKSAPARIQGNPRGRKAPVRKTTKSSSGAAARTEVPYIHVKDGEVYAHPLLKTSRVTLRATPENITVTAAGGTREYSLEELSKMRSTHQKWQRLQPMLALLAEEEWPLSCLAETFNVDEEEAERLGALGTYRRANPDSDDADAIIGLLEITGGTLNTEVTFLTSEQDLMAHLQAAVTDGSVSLGSAAPSVICCIKPIE